MEDNIYNIKHISRPILPPYNKVNLQLYFWPINVMNYFAGAIKKNSIKKEKQQKKKKKTQSTQRSEGLPRGLKTDIFFNIEKYYTKMKYKYIYIYIRICYGISI